MWNFGTEPEEKVVKELHVETADIRHDTQFINLGVSHIVWCEQSWDTEIFFSNLAREVFIQEGKQ